MGHQQGGIHLHHIVCDIQSYNTGDLWTNSFSSPKSGIFNVCGRPFVCCDVRGGDFVDAREGEWLDTNHGKEAKRD